MYSNLLINQLPQHTDSGMRIRTDFRESIKFELLMQDRTIEEDKKISKTQEEALDKAIENRKIADDIVEKILNKYGYSSTAEIKMKDYMKIVNEFQKLVKQE